MKNLVLFFLTCVIATGAFLAGTTMKNPLPALIVAFGVWMLFIYRMGKR
jgi:ABC-type transport system involved in multi-copper enzyme maturation permease subunit